MIIIIIIITTTANHQMYSLAIRMKIEIRFLICFNVVMLDVSSVSAQ